MPNAIPVIYTMSPIGVGAAEEATGVLFFCCDTCRNTAITERRVESDGPIELGVSSEFCDGTVCDECGDPINAPIGAQQPTEAESDLERDRR